MNLLYADIMKKIAQKQLILNLEKMKKKASTKYLWNIKIKQLQLHKSANIMKENIESEC